MGDVLLGQTRCSFGSLRVYDDSRSRRLFVGTVVQGGVRLDAPGQPGVVPAHMHALGFSLALYPFRRGRILMFGLGAGETAVWLASVFPELSIHVVEADPQVAEFALRWFPKLTACVNAGRISLEICEAHAWARRASFDADVMVLDLNDGRNSPHILQDNLEFLALLRRFTSNLWVNHVGTPRQKSTQATSGLLAVAGFPVRHRLCVEPHSMNTLLGCVTPEPVPEPQTWIPTQYLPLVQAQLLELAARLE